MGREKDYMQCSNQTPDMQHEGKSHRKLKQITESKTKALKIESQKASPIIAMAKKKGKACVYIGTRKREKISGNDDVGGGGSQFDGVGLIAAKGSANAEVTVPFWEECEVEGRRGV